MKKEKNELRLSLALLEKEPVRLEGALPPGFLEIEKNGMIQAASEIEYSFEARMITGNVTVSGSVVFTISGECGRCLAAVEKRIAIPDLALFYEKPEGDELDIAEDVRAELLLALPMNLLCSSGCRGLCPSCGANLNNTQCGCTAESSSGDPAEDSPWGELDKLEL